MSVAHQWTAYHVFNSQIALIVHKGKGKSIQHNIKIRTSNEVVIGGEKLKQDSEDWA